MQFGKHMVCLDATHGTCKAEILEDNQLKSMSSYLYTLVVRNNVTGQGSPVCWMVTNSQDRHPITNWLIWLRSLGYTPSSVMIDNSDVEIAAIRQAYGQDVRINICQWHILRAWRKQTIEKVILRNPHRRRPATSSQLIAAHRKEALNRLIAMMKANDEPEFEMMYDELCLWIEEHEAQWDAAGLLAYFDDNYLGKKKEWSNAFRQVMKKHGR